MLLFFLPIIESFNRQLALILLFTGSGLVAYPIFWNRKVKIDFINLIFLLFIFWGLFTTIFSWSFIRSFTEILRYLAYYLLFVAIRQSEHLRVKFFRFFKAFIIFNSLFLSLFFFLFKLFPDVFPKITSGLNLFYPVFGHNRISELLIFSIPLLMGLFIKTQEKRKQIIIICGLIYFFFLLFISLSRGSWWALIASMIFYFMKISALRRYFGRAFVVFTGVGIILSLLIFMNSHFWTTQKEGVNLYLGLYKPINHEKRLHYYNQALKGISNSPIIGFGLDTFRFVSKKYQSEAFSWSWYTHNHFLQIFVETGITGGILFILLFSYLFKNIVAKSLKSREFNDRQLVLVAIIPSFFHTLIDYDWQFVSVLLLIFVGLAISVPIIEKTKSISFRPIYIIYLLMVFSWFVFYSDSDKVLAKNNLWPQRLLRAYRLDSGYNEISKRLAEGYSSEKNYKEGHFWYTKAISLDPLDSSNEIKSDFLLYIQEVEEFIEQKKEENAFEVLKNAVKAYPYLHYKYGNGILKRDNLTSYITMMKEAITMNPIRIWEIERIIED